MVITNLKSTIRFAIMNRFPALVRSSDCDLSWQESATRHCSSRRGCVQALHDIIRPDCGSSGDNWPTTARVAHASDQVISPSLQRPTHNTAQCHHRET